ncbi:hypothetical protein J921_2127 [Acinetobacter baumannii 25493_8]|nr:hypothetical protein J921_2127 [Acinetobacter baumannii 25493_8]EYD54310.1 hypothetical protein J916_3077 [Acinetobacter baumannii 25493_3]EYS53225.1 hypothetical protein K007_0249 [Acinetobacter baumannii 25569_1]
MSNIQALVGASGPPNQSRQMPIPASQMQRAALKACPNEHAKT